MRRSCDSAASSELRSCSRSASSFFGAARQVQPLQRAGDQHREGLQQPLLFRHHQLAQVIGLDRQQAEGLLGGIERQQLVRHAGQGVGAGAGRQAFVEAPACDSLVYRQQPAFLADHLLQAAVFLRQQQHGFRLETAGEEVAAGVGDVGHGQRAAQPARHFVQVTRPLLAVARHLA